MPRDEKKEPAGEAGNFWTSYSDLLLGLSVIFLVLFFFATVRAGLEQMKHAVENKQTAEFLKGKVPEPALAKNKEQTEILKKSMEELQAKKENLDRTAADVTQMVKHIQDQQQVVSDVMKDQLDRAAVIADVSDKNEKLNKQVQDLEALKAQVALEVQAKEEKISELNRQTEALEAKRVAAENALNLVTEDARKKEQELAIQTQNVQRVEKDLNDERAKASQQTMALESERSENQKLQAKALENAELLRQRDAAISEREQSLAGLQQSLAQERAQNAAAQASMQNEQHENQRLADQIRQQEQALQQKELAIQSSDTATAQARRELESQKLENQRVAATLASEQSNSTKLSNELQSRAQELAGARRESDGLTRMLAGSKAEADQLRGQLSGKDRALQSAQRDAQRAQGQLATLNGENTQLRGQLQESTGALAGARTQAQSCEKTLADLRHNLSKQDRRLASMDTELKRAKTEISSLSAERKTIASGIQDNLRTQGVDAQMDPVSGVLTITMDEAFQFKNASYQLTDRAKEKLKQIIPVYAQNLLGKAQNAARIESVTIAGHASPRYRKEFVDPKHPDPLAQKYNAVLSQKRAQQIADYIFGSEIGYYPFKYDLKVRSGTIGKGLMDPVKALPGAVLAEPCGEYDCAKSRRVEISFIMKGDHSGKTPPPPGGHL